jgi:hypothetical protein
MSKKPTFLILKFEVDFKNNNFVAISCSFIWYSSFIFKKMQEKYYSELLMANSVVDPVHFDADPDPTSEKTGSGSDL